MKVIFIQNVPNVGKIDQIKDVSEGYARNYLFSHNLAVPASEKALDDLEAKKTRKTNKANKDLIDQQEIASKLDGWELDVREKVNAEGTLYAAVGPQKISEALTKLGFNIDKKQIEIVPIKQVGEYKAKIKFRHGLEAEIRVTVMGK